MTAPDPCPRCGSACEAVRGPVPDRWGVRCIECGLWADDRERTEAEAIAAWSRRALPATDARAEALQWSGLDRSYMAPGIPCGYAIVGDDEEGWQVSLSWRTCDEKLEGTYPTMDAARAAAETDLQGRLALIGGAE